MKIFFLLFSLFLGTKADYVDTIIKCKSHDSDCLQAQMQSIITVLTTDGLPEYDIKSIGTYDLSNFQINLSDKLSVELIKGSLTGLKNAVIKKYEIDFAKGSMTIEMTCNLLQIDTAFSLSGTDELLQKLLAVDSLAGDGHLSVDIENFYLQFSLPFKVVKGKNENIYLKFLQHENDFKYDFGNLKFLVDKFMIDGKDNSQLLHGILNSTWKIFVNSFGKGIFDTVLINFASVIEKMDEHIPIEKFTSENLTPYL